MKNKRLWIYIGIFLLLAVGVLLWLLSGKGASKDAASLKLPVPQEGSFNVYVLDVGQGDAILLLSPQGKAILVDAGGAGSEETILQAMNALHIDKLSAIVLTHGHEDHTGGALALLEKKKTERLYLSGLYSQYSSSLFAMADKKKIPYENLWGGECLTWEGSQLLLLSPQKELYLGEENADSAVIRFSFENSSLLLCGDATKATEQLLLSLYPIEQLHAQAIKIAHHGAESASSAYFLMAVDPKLALISVGENSYGHPSEAVRQRLEELNIPFYTTKEQGSLLLSLDGSQCVLLP